MQTYYVNYGEGRIEFSLPPSWSAKVVEVKKQIEIPEDPEKEIDDALNNPVKSERIEELARFASEVAILFDDHHRTTPSRSILPYVIERLKKGGIDEGRIRLICASGTHPKPKEEDLKEKIGINIYESFKDRISIHDPFAEHVFIGRSRRGTPVEIDKVVHDCDLIIGIGTCMPHPSSGFGGGYKILMPGVTSYETTERHHMAFIRNRRSRVGILRGNPFYEEIREIGEMGGLRFKIDVVTDEEGRIMKVFAGHPYFEHRKACEYSALLHQAIIDGLSDITITSAHPLEVGVQATKALLLSQEVTRRGGIIIWIAPHEKPGSIGPLLEEMSKPISAGKYHKMFLERGIPDHLKGLGVSYVMQIVHFKEILERFKVIHVTQGLRKDEVEKMGFIYASSIDEAIDMANSTFKEARVLIFPSGGSILPRVG